MLIFEKQFCWIQDSWLTIFFCFQYFEYVIPLPSGFIVSDDKSVVNLIGVPQYIMSHFPLRVFTITSLTFIVLIVMCLGIDLFAFSYLNFVELLNVKTNVFHQIWKPSAIISLIFFLLTSLSPVLLVLIFHLFWCSLCPIFL